MRNYTAPLENHMVIGDYYDERTPDSSCTYCEEREWQSNMKEWCGDMRCESCQFVCVDCQDEPVYSESEFCETCALKAMGVEL